MEKDDQKDMLRSDQEKSNDNAASIEQQATKQWEHIGISNDFIFCKVMQDEDLLAELVHMIIPELEFTRLTVHTQYAVESGMDIHGVRFDIFATNEEGAVVEIEMQVLSTGNLPKRLRFYGSMADSMMLEKGVVYSKLQDSYIVLICPFDEYGLGLHKYTFQNSCNEEPSLKMGDGTTKIVLNALGTKDDVSDKLKAFLDYVAGKSVDDDYVKKVDIAVKKARQNKEWRREYMTLFQRDLENQEIGIEQGIEKGQRDIVIRMLQKGQTPEQISSLTDLSVGKVREIEASTLQPV